MSLLTQFFFLNAGRTGAAAGTGGGLLGPIVGFFALFFFEPYYNAFTLSIESVTGLSGFNPAIPITLMVVAAIMFLWPAYAFVQAAIGNGNNQGFIVAVLQSLIGFAMMAASVPLFIFALVHWAFATT